MGRLGAKKHFRHRVTFIIGENMSPSWKENWEDTQRRFVRWWNREGVIVGVWGGLQGSVPHETVAAPSPAPSIEASFTDASARALRNHYALSRQAFPAEVLPVADTDIGPGSLALFVGSEPGFSPDTVWYNPSMKDVERPESLPPLRFDPTNRWWKLTENTLRECARLGAGKYLVGCPDLIENVDIVSALRDPQTFMMDMVERPEWVARKVWEVNQVWFEAYDRVYQIIRQPDGGSAFGAFRLWGPGRTAKVQCDASAMFSPEMFQRFVVPALTEQCEWLDFSLYHLDGTQCICHLDALLAIEPLDAIEWTPQAGLEGGGSPRWYDLYRRILAAGKSVQVCGATPDEVPALLDAIGGNGVYILTAFRDEAGVNDLLRKIKGYR
jgi:hypothetical protein